MVRAPRIGVVAAIPVHNRRETTLAGLRSLLAADRTGIDLHVIVVDDGSTDGTGDAIRRTFPEVEVVDADGSLHYAAGTNRAIEVGLRHDPAYVLAANDDATFDHGFLVALVACAEQHPRSVVGALLTQEGRPDHAFQVGQQWSLRFGGWQVPQHLRLDALPAEPFEVECIVGNCLLVPTAAIRAAGVLDAARYPRGWGDAEWSVRLRRAGWRQLIAPRARVECEPNTYPPPLRRLGVVGVVRVLLADQRHPLNLRRQWAQFRGTAPSRLQAVAAFGVYLSRLAVKAAGVGAWPSWPDPPADYRPA
jgi:GT2 family glycosyltransferase